MDLVERVRALLAEDDVREVAMFGGRSFMLPVPGGKDGDSMVVAARSGDSLLIRVPKSQHESLLERPGAAQAMMGERTMGAGWVEVSTEAVASDEDLTWWIGIGRERLTRGDGA